MKDSEDGTCRVPKCSTDGAVKFRGRWMCNAHWLHVATADDEQGDLVSESQLARWGWPARNPLPGSR